MDIVLDGGTAADEIGAARDEHSRRDSVASSGSQTSSRKETRASSQSTRASILSVFTRADAIRRVFIGLETMTFAWHFSLNSRTMAKEFVVISKVTVSRLVS